MYRRKLWVEVVCARNLESRQSLDAYCVVQVVGTRLGRNKATAAILSGSGREKDRSDDPLLTSRSTSVQSIGSSATWPHAIEFELEDAIATGPGSSRDTVAGDARVVVQLFNEKNFFFDMFPSSGNSSSSSGRKNSMSSNSCSENSNALDADEVSTAERVPAYETDSDDDDEEHDDRSRGLEHKAQWLHQAAGNVTAEPSYAIRTPQIPRLESELLDGTDEPLGFLELNLALFCNSSRVVTDAWYVLRGTRSGEVRIRTLYMDEHFNSSVIDQAVTTAEAAQARESVFQEQIYGCELRDHYGFKISDHARQEWTHLRSYEDCREERRLSDWELAFGTHFFSVNRCDSVKENSVVRQLARAGIPRSWRERVYMNISGTVRSCELLCLRVHILMLTLCLLNVFECDARCEREAAEFGR